MSRFVEYISPTGLRQDGRRPPEHRRVNVEFGILPSCDGSCEYSVGRCKITAGVYGPRQMTARVEGKSDELALTCEVAMATFSADGRRYMQRRGKVTDDIAAAVSQTLRSVILLGQHAGSQVHVSIEIMQLDGSEKAACINAACLALANASVAMKDVVFAVSTGLIDQKVLTDLTEIEMRSQCPHMCLVSMAHDPEAIVWMEMNSRVSQGTFEDMVSQSKQAAVAAVEASVLPALQQHAQGILAVQLAKAGGK